MDLSLDSDLSHKGPVSDQLDKQVLFAAVTMLDAGLRTASKDSSPPDQNQTRACGASRSARAPKSHQTTTDGAQ
ncbi:hypothetical protein SFRURICE_001394 [Spodoptera frugiperda]|nr:hypothetical protein SFRURICE_001394 [Spodoptera frugiperda]